jgi:hypothetical protein
MNSRQNMISDRMEELGLSFMAAGLEKLFIQSGESGCPAHRSHWGTH